jgi:predicted metal-binding protein
VVRDTVLGTGDTMDCELPLENYGFKEYREFDIDLIRIDQAVRDLCKQNTCGQYNRNHMCPPAIKGIEAWKEEILSYTNAVLVSKVYPTHGGYDFKAWIDGMRDFQKTLVGLKEAVEAQFPDKRFLFLGAGACFICDKCAYLEGKPCRFPEKAFPSLEACGIDVVGLSKSAGVKYNNGKDTVTFLGGILF